MTPSEWIGMRQSHKSIVPEKCKSCRHRMNDYSDGQTCWKIPIKLTLSSGAFLDWPGRPVESAFEECGGDNYERRTLGKLAYWLGT